MRAISLSPKTVFWTLLPLVLIFAFAIYWMKSQSTTLTVDDYRGKLSDTFVTRLAIATESSRTYWPTGLWYFENPRTNVRVAFAARSDNSFKIQVLQKGAKGFNLLKEYKGIADVTGFAANLSDAPGITDIFDLGIVVFDVRSGGFVIYSSGKSGLMFRRLR